MLISLTNSANTEKNLLVKSICLKQMTRLCTMKYDYIVYPHLSSELISIRLEHSSASVREKVLYTKAFCIYELIVYRPDYYAQEFLATISNLINYCNQPGDGGVCAVLINALAVLCETEVVDMKSTFNALYPQFKNETRTLTLNSYCRFMATVVHLEYLNTPEAQVIWFWTFFVIKF